jgi:hypothetical protein
MFGQTWHHDTIRKYVILFGTLFDSIYINRRNASGEVVQTLKVPLNYGPKDKFLARLNSDSTLNQGTAITLPRMAFEITTMNYASDRKLNTINRLTKVHSTDNNKVNYQYSPVPYDFTFSLYIMVKNVEDGTQIVEQILPYFTPEWTATVNLVNDINGKYDIPIILNDVSMEDTYEGNFEARRAVIYTLTYTMKGWLFGPTKTSEIIKEIDVDIRIPRSRDLPIVANTATGNSVVITVTPGLDANGNPTSNSAITVTSDQIAADDNYGYIVDFEEDM